jgi:hypothetical protein
MPGKLTTEIFAKRLVAKFGDIFIFDKTVYTRGKDSVIIGCKCCGLTYENIAEYILDGSLCPDCSEEKNRQRIKKRTHTKEIFIEKAYKVYGKDEFDYRSVSYIGFHKKVDMLHNKCSRMISQTPANHLSGRGCSLCANDKKAAALQYDTAIFAKKAISVHGNEYDYSLVKYIDSRTDVEIIHNKCKKSFWQNPTHHLAGSGCHRCWVVSITIAPEDFFAAVKIIHNDKYVYFPDCFKTVGQKAKMPILCKKCNNIFHILPNSHYYDESGCPICTKTCSKVEKQWLDYIGIPNDGKHRQVAIKVGRKKAFKVDGFDPATNTIYEFYGDFWHGHPTRYDPNKINTGNYKTFGELYTNTINRENMLKAAGYNLITIWESDWRTQQKAKKQLLKKGVNV